MTTALLPPSSAHAHTCLTRPHNPHNTTRYNERELLGAIEGRLGRPIPPMSDDLTLPPELAERLSAAGDKYGQQRGGGVSKEVGARAQRVVRGAVGGILLVGARHACRGPCSKGAAASSKPGACFFLSSRGPAGGLPGFPRIFPVLMSLPVCSLVALRSPHRGRPTGDGAPGGDSVQRGAAGWAGVAGANQLPQPQTEMGLAGGQGPGQVARRRPEAAALRLTFRE